MFCAPCSAMPVRVLPVVRRTQQNDMPSATNGSSTPETPCSADQTSAEAAAAGQNPNRRHNPSSRNPRIAVSSIHGAIRIASQLIRNTYPALRWCRPGVVVPLAPSRRPSPASSGTPTNSTTRCPATATFTRWLRPMPTSRCTPPPARAAKRAASAIVQNESTVSNSTATVAPATLALRPAWAARTLWPTMEISAAPSDPARYSTVHTAAAATSHHQRRSAGAIIGATRAPA